MTLPAESDRITGRGCAGANICDLLYVHRFAEDSNAMNDVRFCVLLICKTKGEFLFQLLFLI